MKTNDINKLNEVLEGLHFGQVIEFKFNNEEYALEIYALKKDGYHSLCLYRFENGKETGQLIFADKITYYGSGDYPIKFQDNYPIEEIESILEKEKAFNGKNFFEAFDDIDILFID